MAQTCSATSSPSFRRCNDFWDALPEIFAWIMSGAEIPQRAHIQHGAGEIAVRSRVLPMSVPVRARSTLEIIRFAAANYLCVDLTYDGSVRRIEPYSLRQTVEGILCCMPSAAIRGSIAPTVSTVCRAPPLLPRPSCRAILSSSQRQVRSLSRRPSSSARADPMSADAPSVEGHLLYLDGVRWTVSLLTCSVLAKPWIVHRKASPGREPMATLMISSSLPRAAARRREGVRGINRSSRPCLHNASAISSPWAG